MRVIDKLRKYIQDGREAGDLAPGSRLPSYHEMMSLWGGSYATVSAAMSKLAREGLVDIRNGSGSFVAGGKKLTIDFYCLPSTMQFSDFGKLLARHIKKNHLNIEINLISSAHLTYHWETIKPDSTRRIIICECSGNKSYNLPGMLHLEELENYDELKKIMYPMPKSGSSSSLPFYAITKVGAMNTELSKQAGFDASELSADFSNWEKLLQAARRKNIPACSLAWPRNAKWALSLILPLMMTLKLHMRELEQIPEHPLQAPFFNTPAGYRLLEILQAVTDPALNGNFYNNQALFDFSIGSWFTVQNHNRPGMSVDHWQPVPYSMGGRRVLPFLLSTLQVHCDASAGNEERIRVWNFMQMLVSKKFQQEFCSKTGMISPRADIPSSKYSWNENGRFACFFPRKDDFIIYDNLFDREMIAYLSALFEQYLFYGGNAPVILKALDRKFVDEKTLAPGGSL